MLLLQAAGDIVTSSSIQDSAGIIILTFLTDGLIPHLFTFNNFNNLNEILPYMIKVELLNTQHVGRYETFV